MAQEPNNQPTRLDRWLWAVRLYKTRSQAIAACNGGHVRIAGKRVKPSRPVRLGEIIEARTGDIVRRYRVLAFLDQRVGAKRVPEFAQDLTPPEEYVRRPSPDTESILRRPKGAGRPTKRERRQIDRLRF